MTFVFEEVGNHGKRQGLGLTARELEVLQMIASGLSNAEAAQGLHLTVHAIKFHLAAIYRRLGVHNRTEAAVAYHRFTIESPDPTPQGD